MSVLANYARFRFLWGGADIELGSGQYPSGVTDASGLGATAAAGDGVGVRRAVVHFDRTAASVGADDAEIHFDFLNLTGGDPDDTWTDADYENLEGHLDTWFAAIAGKIDHNYKLRQFSWYRFGPGVAAPNPAERVVTRTDAGTLSGFPLPPQVACSMTLRTGIRRSWGRTYLPGLGLDNAVAGGRLSGTSLTAIVDALAALYEDANGDDFPMVVVSKAHLSVYAIEAVEVDDVLDVIRRRRWKQAITKTIIDT